MFDILDAPIDKKGKITESSAARTAPISIRLYTSMADMIHFSMYSVCRLQFLRAINLQIL